MTKETRENEFCTCLENAAFVETLRKIGGRHEVGALYETMIGERGSHARKRCTESDEATRDGFESNGRAAQESETKEEDDNENDE